MKRFRNLGYKLALVAIAFCGYMAVTGAITSTNTVLTDFMPEWKVLKAVVTFDASYDSTGEALSFASEFSWTGHRSGGDDKADASSQGEEGDAKDHQPHYRPTRRPLDNGEPREEATFKLRLLRVDSGLPRPSLCPGFRDAETSKYGWEQQEGGCQGGGYSKDDEKPETLKDEGWCHK